MTLDCIALCVHFTITIDRIEHRWAVAEWAQLEIMSDIPLSLFQTAPKEGSTWRIHLMSDAQSVESMFRLTPLPPHPKSPSNQP